MKSTIVWPTYSKNNLAAFFPSASHCQKSAITNIQIQVLNQPINSRVFNSHSFRNEASMLRTQHQSKAKLLVLLTALNQDLKETYVSSGLLYMTVQYSSASKSCSNTDTLKVCFRFDWNGFLAEINTTNTNLILAKINANVTGCTKSKNTFEVIRDLPVHMSREKRFQRSRCPKVYT